LKDDQYVLTYLKQSIELNEKIENPNVSLKDLEQLLDLDLDKNSKIDSNQEEHLFSLLQGIGADKSIANLSEYLLMTRALKGEIKVSSFILTSLDFFILVQMWPQVLRACDA